MHDFKQFKIKTQSSNFPGKKIDITELYNIEIIVLAYKIEPSTAKVGTLRLTLDIEHENKRRITWTGSKVLQEQIQQVPETGFPFKTKIVLNDKRLEFT